MWRGFVDMSGSCAARRNSHIRKVDLPNASGCRAEAAHIAGMATTFPSSPMMRAFAAGVRGNVPTVVWGDPGVGKTAKVSAYAAAWGFHTETVVGSIREASDFLGLPIEVDGEVRYSPPAFARRAADANRALINFDELTTSAPSVSKAMLRIFQKREVGELQLPDTVALVAAANPPAVAVWTGGSCRRRSRTG